MTTNTATDDSFTYHNRFENKIFTSNTSTADMSDSRDLHNDPALQSFTATGRPISKTSASNKGTGLDGYASAESYGAGAPNLLPVRFTDESIISVPVLPPPDVPDSDEEDNPVKGLPSKPKSRFSFSSFRRKSSSSTSKKDKKPDFVIKDMTRAEYLKHYAKDENGKYIGTEEPASDIIIKKEDPLKARKDHAMREAMGPGSVMPMQWA